MVSQRITALRKYLHKWGQDILSALKKVLHIPRIEQLDNSEIEAAIALGLKHIKFNYSEKFYLYGKDGVFEKYGNSMNTSFMLAVMRGGYGHPLKPEHREALKLVFTERAAQAGYITSQSKVENGRIAYTIGPRAQP